MGLMILKCPHCGQSNLIKENEHYRCPVCESIIFNDDYKTYQETVEKLIQEGKEADIGVLRYSLNIELEQIHLNTDNIKNICRQIKVILPEDVIASFYLSYVERKSYPRNYESYLKILTHEKLNNYEMNQLVPIIIKSCDIRTKEVVEELLKKHNIYNEENKEKINQALKEREEELEKYDTEKDVFVCHSSKDIKDIQGLVTCLEDNNISCWYSGRNLPWDIENYWEGIHKAIKDCKVFLFVLSKYSRVSKDVVHELDYARSLNKEIKVEYRIDESENNIPIKKFFDGIQWIDGSKQCKYEELAENIYEKIELLLTTKKTNFSKRKKIIEKNEKNKTKKSKATKQEIKKHDKIEKNKIKKSKATKQEIKKHNKIDKEILVKTKKNKNNQKTNLEFNKFELTGKIESKKSISRFIKNITSNIKLIASFSFASIICGAYILLNNPFVFPKYTQGLEYKLSENGDSYYLVGMGDAVEKNIVISPTHNSLPVTYIADSAFSGYVFIKNISIPDSVTNIGEYAFSGCSSLTSITIPDSVTRIGNYAFNECSSLTSITIGEKVTSIGDNAFYGCSSLEIVTMPMTAINQIKSNSIKKIVISSGEEIPNNVFKDYVSLQSITIPDSVTSIGNYAFNECSSLTSITIPDSVISIGNNAFSSCSSLTSITIPDSVTSIGNYAFQGCSSLTSITIPDSVISIGNSTFWGCSSLENVTMPTTAINQIKSNSIKKIVISSGEEIPNNAFKDYVSLQSITIPDSVTHIGEDVFVGCKALEKIEVNNDNKHYDSRNNCNAIIETSTNTLVVGCKNTIIPDSVTSIGNYAFQGCSSLTSITIPDSVTSIGNYAFQGCSSLTSITIPDSVTSIGNYAFQGCSSLTSITISDSVISIGNNAFSSCSSLTSITIPDSVTSIGNYAFQGCSSLTSITISDSVISIGNSTFWGCRSLVHIEIPEGVTIIGKNTFWLCESLTSITISSSVTSIGDSAFWLCSSLKDVYYTGTKEQWESIKMDTFNGNLLNATIHYNYKE